MQEIIFRNVSFMGCVKLVTFPSSLEYEIKIWTLFQNVPHLFYIFSKFFEKKRTEFFEIISKVIFKILSL